ncbi:hypothetical protein QLX67_11500 [Balneolaceae bacterium ANBcel3]|nr:hypothetical protein [Balneolaceae bacterium ANBcel3]
MCSLRAPFFFIGAVSTFIFLFSCSAENPSVELEPYSDPCTGLSEMDCFELLEECVTADSTSAYLALLSWYNESLSHLRKIEAPFDIRFENANIFQQITMLGGGDHGSYPFITLENRYCPMTADNSRIIFSPISSPDEAFSYYTFLTKDLGNAFSASRHLVTDTDGLAQMASTYSRISPCSESRINKLGSKPLSEMKTIENGYMLTFTTVQGIYEIVFRRKNIAIGIDGRIHDVSETTLLHCGEGPLF